MKKVPDIEPYTPSLAADLDVFRRVLMRRLVDRQEGWRRCRMPICRRQRACLGDSTICIRKGRPAPVLSAEQEALARRDFQTAIKKRLAELDAPSSHQEKEVECFAAPNRTETGKTGQQAHRKKAGGAP